MTAASPVDGVRALAEVAAAGVGLVLEGVTISPAGRRRVLRVVVDLPEDAVGGVPMEQVAAASQALSTALDESPVMGGAPYVLEVSSPGADRLLTEPRHWRRARGRVVRVTVDGGREVTGRLQEVGPDGVVIDGAAVDGAAIGWGRLGPGRVELEFHRPGAAEDEDEDDVLDELDGSDGPDEEGES